MRTSRKLIGFSALTLLASLVGSVPAAQATPVADSDAEYQLCGRVFPDPHAFGPSPTAAPGESPWAKGNAACRATDFIQYTEAVAGLRYLEQRFSRFVQVYDLSKDFSTVLDQAKGEGMSAGLPNGLLGRDKTALYLVRITDETVSDKKKAHFVFPLSIHGIERAGMEGGLRAAEDLATWAATSPNQPIMETDTASTPAGEALKKSAVYFVLANNDGWRRGDTNQGGLSYQRYNGNGVDLNRDWPTKGYTFRPYTPWSEPESRSFGKVLQSIRKQWTGGVDLHGQLIDDAFSFTLLGAGQHTYDKNQRILQFTKGAWADAEQRLSWSPLIKPNTAEPDDPRLYGVQWGTVWDTIDYTTTGSFGDWINSPLGLNGDGIDNEMSLSHLSNCGTGKCYLPAAEQLHIDGNKSLVYGMINFSLQPEDTRFEFDGTAAYLYNPRRLSHAGDSTPKPPRKAQPQAPQSTRLVYPAESTYEFDVERTKEIYNGGVSAEVTFSNIQGVGAGAVLGIAIERRRSAEEPLDGGEWETVNTDYNQAPTYLQSGMRVDANAPAPGRYRLRVFGDGAAVVDAKITFTKEAAWPDPGQLPYDVSNMDFFSELAPFAGAGKLNRVNVDDVLSGAVDLSQFDTVVAADNAVLPGYVDPLDKLNATPQTGTETSVVVPPGAPARSAATTATYEFDVQPGNALLNIQATPQLPSDIDLYLQKQRADGSWSGDVADGASGSLTEELLSYAYPLAGHYRLIVHNWAGPPGQVALGLTFDGDDRTPPPSKYGAADSAAMGSKLRSFASGGGNLVLTDDGLRALRWMDVVPDDMVRRQAVYAGHVAFTADGGDTATYNDPLAENVNQPGAAEGDGHRHQVTEPVPLGYAIQNETGGDFNSQPQWGVDRDAWEDADGRVVGVVGAGDVTLGELPLGRGQVRILGSFLPYPTDRYDHPYGLSDYALTYTGYELAKNLFSKTEPT